MTYLVDVNVLVALLVAQHTHHHQAARWLDEVNHDWVALCRVTQMGVLRLLTNERVLGSDALPASSAWSSLDRLRDDARVVYLGEPPALERAWRLHTTHTRKGANFWTDAYLAAFCQAAHCTFVTFDKALAQMKGVNVRVLS